jgi:hypothetical protein
MHDDTGPYTRAHGLYAAAGWRGVLPVGRAPAQKNPPPLGWTGHAAGDTWPSGADRQTWADGPEGGRNIALRLPADVIGLDVDAYGAKVGGATLAGLVARWGPLPPTWVTSARDDGVSGIRLYRVPPGLNWPGEAGDNIEVVQVGHRYALVWPSINPDAGGAVYRWWFDFAGGRDALDIHPTDGNPLPAPAELPELPAAWVAGLSLPYGRVDPAALDDPAVREWLTACRQGDACEPLTRVTREACQALIEGRARSRHELTRDAVRALAAYGGEGHVGAWQVLGQLRDAFLTSIEGDVGRDGPGEWARLLTGGVRLAAAANPEPRQACDCALRAGQGVMFDPPRGGGIAGPEVMPPELREPSGTIAGQTSAEVESSTWEAEDISAILDGSYVPEVPSLMHREDGVALLYRGRVHSFHGESESGKSMVAQAAVATVLRTGGTAAIIDFESDATTVVPRLLMMGVSAPALRERFQYIRPEARGWGEPAFVKLLGEPLDLAIIDGVTESMMIMGVEKSTDNDQVSRWIRHFPRALARGTGAAVVLIDHVTKDAGERGRFALGAQAKLAALDGAGYTVEVKKPLGAGMKGAVSLRVAKDRPGQVRPHGGEFRARDRTQEVAYVVVDSTTEGRIDVRAWPPKRDVSEQEQLMIAISMYLEGWTTEHGAPLGKTMRDIRGEVPGRNLDITAAANRLAEEGYIAIEVHGRSHIHTSLKSYRPAPEVVPNDSESVNFDG